MVNCLKGDDNMKLIGISGSILKETQAPFSGYNRSYVNEDYVHAVIKAGGIPIILPVTMDEGVIRDFVSRLDGLILSGGHDVQPKLYGENPLRKIGEVFPDRDVFDLKLIEFAKEKQIPILGICRGFQILNVYHGGSLYQDLDYLTQELKIAHSQASGPTVRTHEVDVKAASMFSKIVKNNRIEVNSFHHQAIKELGKELTAVAHADDGIIEAFELESYPWLLGVQFHPEMLHREMGCMQNIFNEFVLATEVETL